MGKFLKNIRYMLEYAIVIVPYVLIRLSPWCVIRAIARFSACIVWAIPSFRKLISANIRTAMPELEATEVRRIGKTSCFHLFLNLYEFIWLTGKKERIEKHYILPQDVTDKLKAHVAAGERIIFVNPHLGSWEASGLMAPYYAGVNMVAIAKPVRNPYLNNLLNHGNREREHGLKIIFAKGAIKAATKALRDGFGVGTLIDQNTRVRDGGAFVRFFGMPVASSKSPAGLMRYCASRQIPSVIVYGSSLRMPDGKVQAFAEWLSKPFDQYETEEEVIQELMDISESYIRRFPEQYLWFYRRFQFIPPDADQAIRARFPYYATTATPKFFSRIAGR